jgi:PAS domain S-box-containing protein
MARPTVQSLEAEIQALRAANQALRAAQLAPTAQQGQVDTYQQSQVRFRTVFDHSPLGHKIIDADLTIRQANAAVATLLGLESSLELIGHAILEFAHPDYCADWARLQAALWTHQLPSFTLETCLLRPNGTVLWCRVTSVLFPDEQGELGYTTLEDISARKQLEAQVHQHAHELEDVNKELSAFNEELQVANEELLEANTKLGKLNAELDTFVYAASHDLRSPISNLEGLVQALRRQLPAVPHQHQLVQPILGMMRESMARFGHTLDRLATFGMAHTAAGLDREQVDLASVLAEVRQEVAPLLIKTQGQLEIELIGLSTLWFASKHVYSVLLNLVSNALKYRHPDRAPVVRVCSYREVGRLVVRVQDNGLGLSEAQQGQLFRLFKRLHAHVEGTGMGLYLVKKILDNAGGSIQVTSEVGRGSTFTAVFPT